MGETAVRRITEPEFTQAMRDAVAERGEDWVYPKGEEAWEGPDGQCRYFLDDGQPACLIGTALCKLGVPGVRPGHEGAYAGLVLHDIYGELPRGIPRAASLAQEVQDEGQPWGEALKAYLRALAE